MAKKVRPSLSIKFTAERLEAFARDLKSQRIPLERQQISDDVVVGLRAVVHRSGQIAFHVSYYVGEERPYMRIGSFHKDDPDFLTIEEARDVARTIKGLGDRGIDVQEGLHRRLIKELKKEGLNWRNPK